MQIPQVQVAQVLNFKSSLPTKNELLDTNLIVTHPLTLEASKHESRIFVSVMISHTSEYMLVRQIDTIVLR